MVTFTNTAKKVIKGGILAQLTIDYCSNQLIIDYLPGVFHVLWRLALVDLGWDSVHTAKVQGDVTFAVLDIVKADETPVRIVKRLD